VTSFGISSPAIVVPRVSLRLPSESAWRGPACHSVRVVGVALYIASTRTFCIPAVFVLGVVTPKEDAPEEEPGVKTSVYSNQSATAVASTIL